MSEYRKPSLSVAKAVLIGHLIVNGPAMIIIAIVAALCVAVGVLFSWVLPGIPFAGFIVIFAFVGLLIGCVLGWLWWSFTVPRWRRWALQTGADPERLQKWAAATGLVWPKGWAFEKTEFKVK